MRGILLLWIVLMERIETFVFEVVPWVFWWSLYGLFVVGVLAVYMGIMIVVKRLVWAYLVRGMVAGGLSKYLAYLVGVLMVGGIGVVTMYGFCVGVWCPVSDSQFFSPRIDYRVVGGVLDSAIPEATYWRDLEALMKQEAELIGARGGEFLIDDYGLDVQVRIQPRIPYGLNWVTVMLVGFTLLGGGLLVYGGVSVLR